jgi:hypothetical protein
MKMTSFDYTALPYAINPTKVAALQAGPVRLA